MPKNIDNQIKIIAITRLNNGEKSDQIAADLNLKSGGTQVKQWAKRYNINELETGLNYSPCKVDIYMKKEIENKVLKDEIKRLEKELQKSRKQELKGKAKIEFLEKCMPSCMNLSISQMKIKTSKKAWKNEAYNILFKDRSKGLTIKEKCSALYVTFSNYSKWRIRNKEVLSKNNEVEFKRKYHPDAIALINEFTLTCGAAGSRIACVWIRDNKLKNVSYKIISELRNNNLVNLPKSSRKSKPPTKEKGNVVPDLIKNNFIASYNFQKIGMDGSYMNLIINGTPLTVLGEFAYNWYEKTMIAYNFSHSENTGVVSKTIIQVANVLKSNCVEHAIIQTDRGSANTSFAVRDLIAQYSNITLSMSEAGFKHNAPTESLNGWNKEYFYAIYGNKFCSINEFYIKFDEFITKRNLLQIYIYNKKRNQIPLDI